MENHQWTSSLSQYKHSITTVRLLYLTSYSVHIVKKKTIGSKAYPWFLVNWNCISGASWLVLLFILKILISCKIQFKKKNFNGKLGLEYDYKNQY